MSQSYVEYIDIKKSLRSEEKLKCNKVKMHTDFECSMLSSNIEESYGLKKEDHLESVLL